MMGTSSVVDLEHLPESVENSTDFEDITLPQERR
jgi:hypothetical protein